jgi:hypothetical protein
LKGFARERDRFTCGRTQKQFSRRINLEIFKEIVFFRWLPFHILEKFRKFEPLFEDILTGLALKSNCRENRVKADQKLFAEKYKE